jgi:hypothetical protein
MRAVPLAAMAVALTTSTAACANASNVLGHLTGAVPVCYGPGPNTNLTPEVTIYVRQDGRLIMHGRFPSDASHPRPYRFALTAGAYSLTSSSARGSISVRVQSGQTTHAHLPEPGCV